jgi:transcriptional regulator with XRE-family HTH domain
MASDYEKLNLLPNSFKLSLNFIVMQRLEEMNMNQSMLAVLLNTTGSKISKILSGKQEPDINFLKAIHQHLGIDGNLLLEVV